MNAQTESYTHLHGRWLLAARLAWTVVFITLAAIYAFGFLAAHGTLSTICNAGPCSLREQILHTDAGERVERWPGPPVGYADRLRPDQAKALQTLGLTLDQYAWLGALQLGIPALVLLLIAAGLFWWKSDDWMALFASIMVATFPMHNVPLAFNLTVHEPAWDGIQNVVSIVALSCLLIFPLIFPTGQFVPRWTRWMAFYAVMVAVLGAFLGSEILNVFGEILGRVFMGVMVVLPFGIAVYAQLYRYFRVARPAERQQFKWVVVGLVGTLVTQFAVLIPLNALLTSPAFSADPARALVLSAIPDTLWQLNNLLIAVCIVISVLRYRLWDVDILIKRSMVYFTLIAVITGLYVLVVGSLSNLLQNKNDLAAPLVALLIVAAVVAPLRRALQKSVNRLLRFDPGRRDESQVVLQKTSESSNGASEENIQTHLIVKEDSSPSTRLHGKWLLITRLAWVAIAMLSTILYIAAAPVAFDLLRTPCYEEPCDTRFQSASEAPSTLQEDIALKGAWYHTILEATIRLLTLGVALLIFWRRSNDWMAHLTAIMLVTSFAIFSPSPIMLVDTQPLWRLPRTLLWAVGMASAVGLFYLFPDGRFVPRWTRGLAITLLVTIGTLAIAGAGFQTGLPLFLVALITGAGFQVYRYRRVSDPLQRQQTKWVVLGITGMILPMLVFFLFAFFNPSLNPLRSNEPILSPRAIIFTMMVTFCVVIPLCFLPLTLAFSILRYRLWDVDIVINRALVYGTLTGIVVGAFVIIVGLLSLLFQSSGNAVLAVIATGLIALLFNPLRQRLQRGINHLMYGERDEPYTALSRLVRQLETSLAPEAVLPTIVTTVRDVLRLPYVAIYLQQDSRGYKIVAESASPLLRIENGRIRVPGMEHEGRCIPLIHQRETVGYIVLGPRAPNEAFSTTDLHLLEDLAPQVGVAVQAVRLTADLQRSRERLVMAREEERRRLRRDLHDGLGPQLAGLALKLETVRNRLRDDPLADSLLADAVKRTQDATADIRHLVYELRPPTLDELGLVMALREGVTQFTQQGCNDLNITFDAPESLPSLPAAVEVAVYRITQEALTNVIRHAEARACSVRLRLDESAGLLCLEIQDDGRGLSTKRRAGVGLNSMRERAEELGGTLTVTVVPTGGTLLTARLPCRLDHPPVARYSAVPSDEEP